MRIAGALAVAAGVAALAVWFTRPGLDSIDRRVADTLAETAPSPGAPGGALVDRAADLVCTLLPERSRVVGEPATDLDFAWNPNGCVNGRTQYGFADGAWTRLFVPNDEDTVSVNRFDPAARSFRTDRYPLAQSAMAKARAARAAYSAPQCGEDGAAGRLGEMQSGVAALLPPQPIERLVYSCRAP